MSPGFPQDGVPEADHIFAFEISTSFEQNFIDHHFINIIPVFDIEGVFGETFFLIT